MESNYDLEAVLASIITILTIVAGILQQLNRKNSAVADVLIRSIERSGNNAVKSMVSKESEEEGNTAFLHKKVQNVVGSMPGATPTDAFRQQPGPPASPDGQRMPD